MSAINSGIGAPHTTGSIPLKPLGATRQLLQIRLEASETRLPVRLKRASNPAGKPGQDRWRHQQRHGPPLFVFYCEYPRPQMRKYGQNVGRIARNFSIFFWSGASAQRREVDIYKIRAYFTRPYYYDNRVQNLTYIARETHGETRKL
jgi:hypothetical protein